MEVIIKHIAHSILQIINFMEGKMVCFNFLIFYLILFNCDIYCENNIKNLRKRYNYGISLMARGKYEDAVKIYKEFINLGGKIPRDIYIMSHIHYAYASYVLKRYEEVVRVLGKLKKISKITRY